MRRNIPKQKNRIKKSVLILLLVLVFAVIGILVFISQYINPVIIAMSEAKIKSYAVKAVNNAVYTVLGASNIYDDLIDIQYDANGNIILIQAKSASINRLSKELTREAQLNIEQVGNEGINIPIGSLTGMPVFVGRGPDLNIKLMPIGSVYSSFVSQFVASGINQTNHRIYLNMEAKVNLILPVVNKTITSVANVLICETIIVGKVPEVYLSSQNLQEMLSLVP